MSSSGGNFHKKGEHVFNDIAGSLENAFIAALGNTNANSLVLMEQFGPLNLYDFPRTSRGIDRFNQDPILTQARTIVAPATGLIDDSNSRNYGDAKRRLEQVLLDAVEGTADLMWRRRPHPDSSFHAFELTVAGFGNIPGVKNVRRLGDRGADRYRV